MRKKIVAGNWKMNKSYDEAIDLANGIINHSQLPKEVLLILSPPFPYLKEINSNVKNNISVAAQNCHQESSGAFTGEVSPKMLNSMQIEYVILGHSGRRAYANETNDLLKEKVNSALINDLNVIFCCGETLDEREKGIHLDIIEEQLQIALFSLDAIQFSNIIIAYEPVWAIGTGVNASPAQAQEIHNFIRALIANKYGSGIAESTSILYGGSCKPGNAKELFSQQDVDGGLIGGASLNANDFIQIANSF